MGAILLRPFKNYNIEARAMKVIEKSKPVSSPRYPTEAALEERAKASGRKVAEEIPSVEPELNDRLKHVYVNSVGDNPVLITKRELPYDRRQVPDVQFGYLEPSIVPKGKLSLRQALEMINIHKDDPEKNSAKVLADKYGLDVATTYKILEYFHPLNLRLPKAENLVQHVHPMLKERKLKEMKKLLADTENKLREKSL